eukprot:m.199127 g.199127  ORF g.199127 m.199127 type:complete len:1155 (-) comp32723_c0_seq4:40-3504(-)
MSYVTVAGFLSVVLLYSTATVYNVVAADVTEGDECNVAKASMPLVHWELNKETEMVKPILVAETADLLAKIEGNISIVSIVGPYRSGKSHLLNQLLPKDIREMRPFEVGHTVNSQTETIDAYVLPACRHLGRGQTIILLDSPGLFAPNRMDSYDYQALAFMNLLSSDIIFNNQGVVERSFVLNLAKALKMATDLQPSGTIQKPSFRWVIQNLELQLTNDAGEKITGTEYIQDMLSKLDNRNGGDDSLSEQFSDYFDSLQATIVPSPKKDPDETRQLEDLPESAFREVYLKTIETLRTELYPNLKVKEIAGRRLEGDTLAAFLKSYASKLELPLEERRAAFNMQTFSSELDKVEYDKMLLVATQATRRMHYPVDKQVFDNSRSNTLALVEKYNDRPTFKTRLEEAISNLYKDEWLLNSQAKKAFVHAGTTVVTEMIETVMPQAPDVLKSKYWEMKSEFLKTPKTHPNGENACGLHENSFYGCTGSSQCCNVEEGRCGNGEDCLCESCLDFSNFWTGASDRVESVVPELEENLGAVWEARIVGENDAKISVVAQGFNDHVRSLFPVEVLPLSEKMSDQKLHQGLVDSVREDLRDLPRIQQEYVSMKEQIKSWNSEGLGKFSRVISEALNSLQGKLPTQRDALDALINEKLDEFAPDDSQRILIKTHIADEKMKLVNENNARVSRMREELTNNMQALKVKLPLPNSQLEEKAKSAWEVVAQWHQQRQLVSDSYASLKESLFEDNEQALEVEKIRVAAEWKELWQKKHNENRGLLQQYIFPETTAVETLLSARFPNEANALHSCISNAAKLVDHLVDELRQFSKSFPVDESLLVEKITELAKISNQTRDHEGKSCLTAASDGAKEAYARGYKKAVADVKALNAACGALEKDIVKLGVDCAPSTAPKLAEIILETMTATATSISGSSSPDQVLDLFRGTQIGVRAAEYNVAARTKLVKAVYSEASNFEAKIPLDNIDLKEMFGFSVDGLLKTRCDSDDTKLSVKPEILKSISSLIKVNEEQQQEFLDRSVTELKRRMVESDLVKSDSVGFKDLYSASSWNAINTEEDRSEDLYRQHVQILESSLKHPNNAALLLEEVHERMRPELVMMVAQHHTYHKTVLVYQSIIMVMILVAAGYKWRSRSHMSFRRQVPQELRKVCT